MQVCISGVYPSMPRESISAWWTESPINAWDSPATQVLEHQSGRPDVKPPRLSVRPFDLDLSWPLQLYALPLCKRRDIAEALL
jgi:hypothetical protein